MSIGVSMRLMANYFLSIHFKKIQQFNDIKSKQFMLIGFILSILYPITTSAANNPSADISLSPHLLFLHADIVVKTVIVLLILASLFSWIIWVAKVLEIRKKNQLIRSSIDSIETQRHLKSNLALPDYAADLIFKVAIEEYDYAVEKKSPISQQTIKDRVCASLDRIIASDRHHLSLGISFLATTGAIAPFVGLLGTVWGIMHSFISIAQNSTTDLSVVAPGIAEALFATALGLFAAIPAVILYNHIIRAIAHHTLLVEDSATVVVNLLSRELEKLDEKPSQADQHALTLE